MWERAPMLKLKSDSKVTTSKINMAPWHVKCFIHSAWNSNTEAHLTVCLHREGQFQSTCYYSLYKQSSLKRHCALNEQDVTLDYSLGTELLCKRLVTFKHHDEAPSFSSLSFPQWYRLCTVVGFTFPRGVLSLDY